MDPTSNYQSVQEVVRRAEANYISGTVLLGEHVQWSLRDTVERIFAYLNNRHITGDKDSLGRDKPFFNIVTGAVNVWYKATEIDRKDVTVQPDSSETTALTFVATVLLQDWMKRERFGVFLKQWGRTLAQYGSAVVKFVERDGKLHATVVPWNRLICDPIDFKALPTIEKLYKTPAQLRNMATPGHPDYAHYDLDVVNSLVSAVQSRKTLEGMNKDNRAEFIPLYEVHGEMPVALLTENPQDATDTEKTSYRQQMHVISFVQSKSGGSKTAKFQDFTLYKGKEKKDPYIKTDLITEDGRTLSIGAVEYLFDAQWMQNHTMKQWKDQLDIASKLIFQTADKNFIGRNVLTAIETGDILIHDPNTPLEIVPNAGHDITNLQAYSEQWKALAQDVTSTPDAMRGKSMGLSVTAARQTSLLMQAATSFFEVMTENKGLALEDMLREFIIPHLMTQMRHKKEIATILEDHQITKLDAMYVPREAIRRHNEQVKSAVLANGEALLSAKEPVPVPQFDPQAAQAGVRSDLSSLGNQRFFSPDDINWSDALKDLEWKLDVGITNEQHDKQAIYQTLSTVLQTLATNPGILQDPNAKLVFAKILDQTGVVSPIEISTAAAAPQPPPGQPGQPGATPMPTMAQPMPTPSPLAALSNK